MMKFARRTASEDDSLQCQRIGTPYSRGNTPGFSILFLQFTRTCNAVITQMLHKFIQCFHCTPIRQSHKG